MALKLGRNNGDAPVAGIAPGGLGVIDLDVAATLAAIDAGTLEVLASTAGYVHVGEALVSPGPGAQVVSGIDREAQRLRLERLIATRTETRPCA